MIRPTWNPVSIVLGLAILGLAAPVRPAGAQVVGEVPPPPAPGVPEGAEVMTRGPIHEAFAEPVVYDPAPSPVVPKEPPPPVEETPPDQRPEGANVRWIPGYWAWDDIREDYLWISGLWRDIPPGRQWVPGYWSEAEGGYRWVPGAWTSTAQPEVSYYPTPPASLEAGPNSPPPSPGSVWSPGYWDWQGDRFAWRPGFWIDYRPDWVWVPAHYVWTPSGCLFVDGYWDWPVDRRGTPFAPVYFAPTPAVRPQLAYSPTVTLVASAIWTSIFIQPHRNQYCFGDYYAQGGHRGGAVPWYDFHHGRRGYDPLFAHYSARESRRDPRFLDRMRDDDRFRREHPESRPPQTYREQQRFAHRPGANQGHARNSGNNLRNVEMARPISQVAANANQPLKFTRVDEAHRRELTRQGEQFREVRRQRANQERQATPKDRADRGGRGQSPARPPGQPGTGPNDRPRKLAQFRSPIAGPPSQGQHRIVEQRKEQQQHQQAELEKARRHQQQAQQAKDQQHRDQVEQAKAQHQRQRVEQQKAQRLVETAERQKAQRHQAEQQAKAQHQRQQAEQQAKAQHQRQQAEQQAKAQHQRQQAEQQAEQAKQQHQRQQAEQQARAQQHQHQRQAEQARAQHQRAREEPQKAKANQDRPRGKQQARPGEGKNRPGKKD